MSTYLRSEMKVGALAGGVADPYNNKKKSGGSTYYVPGTVLIPLRVLTHVFLKQPMN